MNGGDVLRVILVDAANNTSEPVGVLVPDTSAPEIPSDLEVNEDGTSLLGRGEIGATVTVRDEQGNSLGTATVSDAGSFVVAISPAQDSGQLLEVVLTDTSGNASATATVEAPLVDGWLQPESLQLDTTGAILSGESQAGATVRVTDVGGEVLGSTTVSADGSFTVALSSPQNNGQLLAITAMSPLTGTSAKVNFLTPDTQLPSPPSELNFNASGTELSGVGEANASIKISGHGGAIIGTGQAGTDGRFTLDLTPEQIDAQSLFITQTDLAGNVSSPATITAPDLTPPLEPVAVVSEDGVIVSGHGEIGATVSVSDAGGDLLGSATIGGSGRFDIELDEAQVNGQQLVVKQTDAADNASPGVNILAPDIQAPTSPSHLLINDIGTQISGQGEAGATVIVRDQSGTTWETAIVAEDGKFEVVLSPAQTNGEQLQVSQSDEANNRSPSSSITAPDTTAPEAVTNVEISTDGVTISGNGEAGATITVTAIDGVVLGSTSTMPNGGFSLVLDGAQVDGQLLKINQTDQAGNLSTAISVTAPDSTAPPSPADLMVNETGTTLSGSAEPNSIVEVRSANGTSLGTGATNDAGAFNVLLNTAQLNGELLQVTASDGTNISLPASITASDTTPPMAVENLSVSADGSSLSGIGEPNSSITVLDTNEVIVGSQTANSDGAFVMTFAPPIASGSMLSVTSSDQAGNISPSVSIRAPGDLIEASPNDLLLSDDGLTLTGTATPGSSVAAYPQDDTDNFLGSAPVDGNGKFTINLNGAQLNGEELAVIATSSDGVNSTPTTFSAPDVTAPDVLSQLNLAANGVLLTGRGEVGATVLVLDTEGGGLGTTRVLADGNFSLNLVPPQVAGQTLDLRQTDDAGNESVSSKLVAPDLTPPAPAENLLFNAPGSILTGTGEAETEITLTRADGTVIGTGEVGIDGSFLVQLNQAQSNGEHVFVSLKDDAGNRSAISTIVAPDITPPSPASDLTLNAEGTVLTGSGETGAQILVTNTGGVTLGTGTVSEDGNFSIELLVAQSNGETISIEQRDAAGNASMAATLQVADITPPAEPVITALTENGQVLTGTGESGASVTVYDVNNGVLGTGTVAVDGSFDVTLSPAQLNGQSLTVQQVDRAGNASPTSTFTVPDVQVPGAPTALSLAANGVSLTGSGEPGTSVAVYGSRNDLLGAGAVSEDGTFAVTLTSPQLDGETLTINLTDVAGNTSTNGVLVAPDATAPEAPGNIAIVARGTVVTGAGVAESTVVVRNAEGAALGTALVDASGLFSVTLDAAQIDNQVLSITQADAAGNVSDAATATAPDFTPPPAATSLQVSDDGRFLGGIGEAGAAIFIRNISGDVLGTGSVGAGGTFNVSLNPPQINGENLFVSLQDSSDNISSTASVLAPDIDADAPVIASDNLATANVSLLPVSETQIQADSFTTLLSGFAKDFSFTVASDTTADPTLTLSTQSLLSLLDGVFYTLQARNASGGWDTLDVNGNAGLLDLISLGSQSLRVDIGDLLAGDYRLRVSSTGVGLVTTVTTQLQLDISSLTQFNGVAGLAVTGNIITDAGIDGEPDQTGPDHGAVLEVMQDGSYVAAETGTSVQGLYGTLIINPNGSYIYTPGGSAGSVGKVDVFSYQLVHPNGLSDTADLYVRIDSPQATEIWSDSDPGSPALVVDAVNDLAQTSINLANLQETSTATLGTFGLFLGNGSETYATSVSADTVSDLTVSLSASNLLSLLGSTTVTLLRLNPATGRYDDVQSIGGGALLNLGGGDYGVTFENQPPGSYQIRVGVSGIGLFGSVTTSLTRLDTYSNQFVVGNTLPVSGNFFSGAAEGSADVLGSALTVLSVLVAGSYVTPGYTGTAITGNYGTLVVQADGNYSYTLQPGLPTSVLGQSDAFTYRLTHPNGSTDTATLTIDLEAASIPAGIAEAAADSVDNTTTLVSEEQSQNIYDGDVIDGSEGGAVNLQGGNGDDTILVVDQEFASVDGGGGTNTLLWMGGDTAINLEDLQERVRNIDVIDLNESSAVDLTLSLSDVLAITSADSDRLLINGDTEDTLHLTEQRSATNSENVDGIDYTNYVAEEDPSYHLWVQNGVQVV